ncbi:adenylate/guanylate cyclase domain-containing protein [Nocardioides sp.]|uniref:adenylate/guanylate cyclase domain-containing protein n=1 Tax=Nocardioides sp. TaxID=35761 RepID=UPI003511EC98
MAAPTPPGGPAPEAVPDPPDPRGAESTELLRAILGEEPSLTAEELAGASGTTVDHARRLWRALGLPEADQARAFTPADADAIRRLTAPINEGLIDLDLAVALTRALGQTMARLADWEASALVHRVEELEQASGGTRMETAQDLLDGLGANFEQLLIYAWRRHLAAAVTRIMAVGEADPNTVPLTVGFADIVSFTALSNELSRERIGDLVELFESRCADVVAAQRGRIIKSLGDSVLFVNDDPVRAYDTAEGIITVIGRDSRMPDVRVGLASGSVVTRLGDVFGPPVNMAARLTNVARRNRIIIDAETAALLPPDQFETRRLPARPVRGFGLVEPVAVRRQ